MINGIFEIDHMPIDTVYGHTEMHRGVASKTHLFVLGL
jgi:hypothetical protein